MKAIVVENERLGKWATDAAMIRLVRQLQDQLDEAGLITGADIDGINNVLCPFIAKLPKKVWDEVREG